MITIYFIPLFLITGLYALYMGNITKIDYVIQAVLSIVISVVASLIASVILDFLGF